MKTISKILVNIWFSQACTDTLQPNILLAMQMVRLKGGVT